MKCEARHERGRQGNWSANGFARSAEARIPSRRRHRPVPPTCSLPRAALMGRTPSPHIPTPPRNLKYRNGLSLRSELISRHYSVQSRECTLPSRTLFAVSLRIFGLKLGLSMSLASLLTKGRSPPQSYSFSVELMLFLCWIAYWLVVVDFPLFAIRALYLHLWFSSTILRMEVKCPAAFWFDTNLPSNHHLVCMPTLSSLQRQRYKEQQEKWKNTNFGKDGRSDANSTVLECIGMLL